MRPRTAFGIELPKWFTDELDLRDPEPNLNTVFGLLLEDYLKRNAPPPPKYDDRACDHEMMPEPGCSNCDLWIHRNSHGNGD